MQWTVFESPLISAEFRRTSKQNFIYALRIFPALLVAMLLIGNWMFPNKQAAATNGTIEWVAWLIYVVSHYLMLANAILVAPLFCASAFTRERDTEVLDMLRLANIGTFRFVISKYVSAILMAVTLVLSCLPMLSLAVILSGCDLGEFFTITFSSVQLAFTCCALGILCSAWFRRHFDAYFAAALLSLLAYSAYTLTGPVVLDWAWKFVFPIFDVTGLPLTEDWEGWIYISASFVSECFMAILLSSPCLFVGGLLLLRKERPHTRLRWRIRTWFPSWPATPDVRAVNRLYECGIADRTPLFLRFPFAMPVFAVCAYVGYRAWGTTFVAPLLVFLEITATFSYCRSTGALDLLLLANTSDRTFCAAMINTHFRRTTAIFPLICLYGAVIPVSQAVLRQMRIDVEIGVQTQLMFNAKALLMAFAIVSLGLVRCRLYCILGCLSTTWHKPPAIQSMGAWALSWAIAGATLLLLILVFGIGVDVAYGPRIGAGYEKWLTTLFASAVVYLAISEYCYRILLQQFSTAWQIGMFPDYLSGSRDGSFEVR
jgi:hypothetical protein